MTFVRLRPLTETTPEGASEAAGEDRGEAEGAAGDGAQVQHGQGARGEGHRQVSATTGRHTPVT